MVRSTGHILESAALRRVHVDAHGAGVAAAYQDVHPLHTGQRARGGWGCGLVLYGFWVIGSIAHGMGQAELHHATAKGSSRFCNARHAACKHSCQ